MHTFIQPALKRFLFIQLLPLCLLLLLCFLLVTGLWEQRASAKDITVANTGNLHFSQHVRLGFHSGDDWEPSITADSFGHIFALYKHYDVTGGQTVAVAYDDGFNTWVSISLDGGKHWAVHEIFPGSNQCYMSLSAGEL